VSPMDSGISLDQNISLSRADLAGCFYRSLGLPSALGKEIWSGLIGD